MNGKVPDTPSAACEEAAGKRPEGCRQAGAKGSEGSTGRRKGAVAAGQARSDQGDRQRYLHPGGEKAAAQAATPAAATREVKPTPAEKQAVKAEAQAAPAPPVVDRKSVVWGKSGSVRVDHGGRRTIKK